jgi:hypothetical protein
MQRITQLDYISFIYGPLKMSKPAKLSLLNKTAKLLVILTVLFATDRETPTVTSTSISFAGIPFDVIENGVSDNRYIWLHGDEQTAKMILEDHIKSFSGKAFFIKCDEREVPFESTKIDPNRIFSREGSRAALRKFKSGWNARVFKTALDNLDYERDYFLVELFPENRGLLIALHNNFRGYNIKEELSKSRLSSIKRGQNPRDFIICTQESDYRKLEMGPYNLVLQDQLPTKDDGSLSWAALRDDIRYINIETRLGWLSKQRKMLKFVIGMLK